MFQQYYNMKKCFVCRPSRHPCKMILKTLLKHLMSLTANNRIHIQQTRHCQDKQGFLSLIRMMDLDRQALNHASETCKHSKLYNLFKRALGCNSDTFNYVCRIAASKISEKYYHMWLLECQLRNIRQRVAFPTLDQISSQKDNAAKDLSAAVFKNSKGIKREQDKIESSDQKDQVQGQMVSRPFTDPTIQGVSKKFLLEGNEASFYLATQKKK